MKSDKDALAEIFQDALYKYRIGEKKYGPYDPGTDQRDMIKETEGEVLDAINYLAMFLIKMRATRLIEHLHCPYS